MTSDILVRSEGQVRAISFNRPDKKNAITTVMYAALADALEEAATDSNVRVVTISSTSDIFTAGNDITDFLAAPADREDPPVFRFLRALASFPKPIVAAVAGQAIGIGTTLLLHSDLVLATPESSFSMPFVDLALIPEAASSMLLPKLIGPQRAAKHLLLCDPFDAQTAFSYGLVSEIVPREALSARMNEIAGRLAAKPPEAIRITKSLLRADEEPVGDRIKRESAYFGERLQSAEAKEVFTAFLEKRPPNFG